MLPIWNMPSKFIVSAWVIHSSVFLLKFPISSCWLSCHSWNHLWHHFVFLLILLFSWPVSKPLPVTNFQPSPCHQVIPVCILIVKNLIHGHFSMSSIYLKTTLYFLSQAFSHLFFLVCNNYHREKSKISKAWRFPSSSFFKCF